MRFDANVSILFPRLPVLRRPAAAAAAGFDAIEMWWPFGSETPSGREVDDLVDAVGEAGVRVVLLNLPTGDPDADEHGLVALAAEQPRFRAQVDAAVNVARRLGASIVNCHFGNPPPGAARPALDAMAAENLAFAAQRCADVGSQLVIEALNPTDFPRYGLTRLADAVELVRRAGDAMAGDTAAARPRILFDAYHVELAEGDVASRFAAAAPWTGHVQVADAPGRGRPGTGRIPFDRLFAALERAGYGGYVGLEYRPSADPADTFAWLTENSGHASRGDASRPPPAGHARPRRGIRPMAEHLATHAIERRRGPFGDRPAPTIDAMLDDFAPVLPRAREPISSEVTRRLLDYLISGQIKPGERLPSERSSRRPWASGARTCDRRSSRSRCSG